MSGVSSCAASVSKVAVFSGSSTVYQDVTHDGKKDTIKFSEVKGSNYTKQLKVYVNGKLALTTPSYDDLGTSIIVNYIYQTKSREFLQIYSWSDDGQDKRINQIYSYNSKTGKFKKVLDLYQSVDAWSGYVVSAASKEITVEFWLQPCETGFIIWNFKYTFTDGKFKLESSTAKVTSLHKKNNHFKVANSFKLYKTASLSKVSFVAKRGAVLTLKKIKYSKGKFYLQFKSGSKTGWQKVGRSYSAMHKYSNGYGWFYDINIAS